MKEVLEVLVKKVVDQETHDTSYSLDDNENAIYHSGIQLHNVIKSMQSHIAWPPSSDTSPFCYVAATSGKHYAFQANTMPKRI